MRRKNRKPSEAEARLTPAADPSGSVSAISRWAGMSRAKRRWIRLGLAVVAPLLFFLGLELALRLAGYGYPTHFFIRHELVDSSRLVENQRFGWRFFPRPLVRYPWPVTVTPQKPAGVYRIFVFGESAALGDPIPQFGFSRILQVLLREVHPEVNFEVINVSCVAINSHVILPIARDCAALQGDMWLIYMGNNEPTGPFGADPVYTRQTPPRPLIRASLALKTTGTGQLLDQLLSGMRGQTGAPQFWGGMEMHSKYQVLEEDVRMRSVYDNFEKNLQDIVRAGTASGAKVIVSTMVCNLRDCAPFGSLHRSNLTAPEQAEWEKAYQRGSTAQSAGRFAEATNSYAQAMRVDDTFADLQFRLGHCYLELGLPVQARKSFERARDLDTLRFRADGRINEIIRRQGGVQAPAWVHLLDAEAAFAQKTKDGIPGKEWLYEHAHFKFEGNYQLARLFAEELENSLPATFPGRHQTPVQWLTLEKCAERLAFTVYSQNKAAQRIRLRKERPPFTGQFDHESDMRELTEYLAQLRPSTKVSGLERDSELCRKAVAAAANDWMLHDLLAYLRGSVGDTQEASKEWQRVTQLMPHYAPAYCELGKLQQQGGHLDEARALYKTAVQANSEYADAHFQLGLVLLEQGQKTEAARHFRDALRIEPDFAEARKKLDEAQRRGGGGV